MDIPYLSNIDSDLAIAFESIPCSRDKRFSSFLCDMEVIVWVSSNKEMDFINCLFPIFDSLGDFVGFDFDFSLVFDFVLDIDTDLTLLDLDLDLDVVLSLVVVDEEFDCDSFACFSLLNEELISLNNASEFKYRLMMR